VAEQTERIKPLIASWDEGRELIPVGGLDVDRTTVSADAPTTEEYSDA